MLARCAGARRLGERSGGRFLGGEHGYRLSFAALRGEECVGLLVGAQTARRSAAVTIARAPDELVDQAAQAGLLYGPRAGACYYVLSQSDTLGSSNAFALLGAKVDTSATRKELPPIALLDRRESPTARLEIIGGVRVSELRGVHP
jgi:hypothetical protein